MFSSDPFQRLTAGGTYNRTFKIFAERYDLFVIISGIIFVPLACMSISLSKFFGSSMNTMIDAMNSLDPSQQQNFDAYNSAVNNVTSNYYDGDTYDGSAAVSFAAGSNPMGDAFLANMSSFGTQFVLEYLALLLVAIAGKAAMAYAVAEMYAGRDPSWLVCFKKGLSRWCDIFGSAALVSLGVFACNILFEIVILVLASMQNSFMHFLGFLVMVAWMVFLTYVMVSLMILAPVIMVEGKGPINSIKRCWELSSNNRCYIFCTVFCLCMLYYVCQLVLTGILYSAAGPESVFTTGGAFLIILPALIYLPLAVM
jgi:hypothetical protein